MINPTRSVSLSVASATTARPHRRAWMGAALAAWLVTSSTLAAQAGLVLTARTGGATADNGLALARADAWDNPAFNGVALLVAAALSSYLASRRVTGDL